MMHAWDQNIRRTTSPAARVTVLVVLSVVFVLLFLSNSHCLAEGSPKLAATEWPMFRGGPQQTGLVPGTLPEKLKVRWTFEAGDVVTSTAAIVDGKVYFGCDDEHLYSLDFASGKLRWKHKINDMVRSSPTVVGESVYFGDSEGFIHAIDVKDGKERWKFETMGEIVSSANYHDGRLLVGSYDGFVYCLSAKDGKLFWKHETGGRVHGTPGIVGGQVVVAGCDEYLRVLRIADGEPVTKVTLDSVSGASAALSGNMAYVGTYGGSVLGIDWKSSTVAWAFHDADREFPFMSSAAVGKDTVVVGGRDKRLHAFDTKTGKQRWVFVTKGRVESSPVIVGDRVFVGSSDGFLYAVDLTTGKRRWQFEAGAPISASPAVAHQCLVIGTEDGVVYCFGAP